MLVSTVNTSSVDDHKENKVILNGRLRFFAAFDPVSDSVAQAEFVSFARWRYLILHL